MLSTLSLEAFTNRSWILVQTILKLAKSIDHKIIFAISINSISIIIPYFEKVMIIKWKTSEDREINSYGQNSIQLLITLNSVFFPHFKHKKSILTVACRNLRPFCLSNDNRGFSRFRVILYTYNLYNLFQGKNDPQDSP